MSKFQRTYHLFFLLWNLKFICNFLSLLVSWMGSLTSFLSSFCHNHFYILYQNNWNCNQLYSWNICIWLLLADLHNLYKQHSGHIFLLNHTYSSQACQNGYIYPGLNNSYIYKRVHTISLSVYKHNVICIQDWTHQTQHNKS